MKRKCYNKTYDCYNCMGKYCCDQSIYTNMKEVKITIPDNCELIKEGDSYVVKEKKNNHPRSWEEFCDTYPIREEEAYITGDSNIKPVLKESVGLSRYSKCWKNNCTSVEEAKAFLALMQLRQLRKAWVGDFNPTSEETFAVIACNLKDNKVKVSHILCTTYTYSLTFPNVEMAEDFLSCFRDLCETAKILL